MLRMISAWAASSSTITTWYMASANVSGLHGGDKRAALHEIIYDEAFAPSGFFGHFGKYNDRNDDI